MTNWYTSDLHFGHSNIIKICPNRKYNGVGQMNEEIIKCWNYKVTPNDTVYVLGDAFFYNKDNQRKIMNKLNGKKILIIGNHDKFNGHKKDELTLSDYLYIGWDEVIFNFMIKKIGNYNVGLVHDPALCNLDRNMYWLCGHVHNLFHRVGRVINVGVDVNNFSPLSDNDIIRMIKDGN